MPKTLLAHYEQLMAGTRCERNGVVIQTGGRMGFAQRDLATMERLLKMALAWEEIEKIIGTDWLPRLFDALWMVNLDWSYIRNDGEKRRVALIDKKPNENATRSGGRVISNVKVYASKCAKLGIKKS